ncbi:MAG TPA: helix-turn-helix domain-containing protein [Bordetella sp.]|nr:helix-turn-helix domain-containing protein [Bordetella sp.]
MAYTKADQLTSVALAVFRLNGLLLDWGDAFGRVHRLTSARWQMLGALALAARPLSAPQIAYTMGVTRQGAQKQLHLLVREALVEVRQNPMHKRSPLYTLTAQGQRVYGEIDKRWRQHVERLSKDFSASDLAVASRVLAALADTHAILPEPTL